MKVNYVTILKFYISEQVSHTSIVLKTSNLLLAFRWTLEPGYNDIGLSGTPHLTSDILWYQLIPH
jgi:hypothetical protein